MRFYAAHNNKAQQMNRQKAQLSPATSLKYTLLTAALMPVLSQAQTIEGYQQTVINAYNEAFSGVCEPARQPLKLGDQGLAPGAVAMEADQTELEGQNLLIFTGNAELEQNGMHINADRLSYDRLLIATGSRPNRLSPRSPPRNSTTN